MAVGSLKHFSGLGAEADMALTQAAGEAAPKKHVANFRWTPGQARVGLGMGKGMYEWIKASFAQGNVRRGGVFRVADFNGKVQSAINFDGGVVSSVTVPKCDGSAKEAGLFDITFAPEQVRWVVGGGEVLGQAVAARAKEWLTSNFKLSIGSLPCERVATVDAFTWRCELVDSGGLGRRPGPQWEARVTVPDIRLTISAADFPAWAEAARKWFVDGQRQDADEMQGRITLLDPTLKEANALGWIDLVNVGFKAFNPAQADLGLDHLERFSVELYVEKMLFTIKALEP